MKKFILTMLSFCFVQFSICQSIKSIRINNAIQGHSWSYAISEIDSITYDEFSQLQKIYVNGECKESKLEDVDSVSFLTDEPINIILSKDYIEDADSYIFSNGIILTEKEDSVQGKILIVDSLDVTQSQWSEDKSFMIYCDSTYKPLIAKDSRFIYYFEYDNKEKLIEINASDLEGNSVAPINANVRKNATTRVSTEGWTIGDDIGAALDLYSFTETLYNPTSSNLVTTVSSWLARLLPSGIPQDFVILLPSLYEALKGNKAGLLGAILSYEKLIQSIGENRAKDLIGDCTPYIKSAYIEEHNTAIINVQIDGVTSTTRDTPYYVIKYWQVVNGNKTNVSYYTTPQQATNGTHPITINNLNGGQYGFQVLIFPSICLEHKNMINLYNFRSNIAYVDISPLYFKVLEQDSITYADNNVIVSMKAVLGFPSEQDETILSYYDSYGIYYYYDDNVNESREEYISIKKNGGNEFYIKFEIPRGDFRSDFSNFTATCLNRIIFKTYTINGWGIKEFYDEQKPNIVYNDKPSLTFTNVQVGSPTATPQYDEFGKYKYTLYKADVKIDYKIEGAFWMKYAQSYVDGDDWSNYEGPIEIFNDGEFSNSTYITYTEKVKLNFVYFYDIYLNNGTIIYSKNTIAFGGTHTNPTARVGGAPSNSRGNRSAKKRKVNNAKNPIFEAIIGPL